MGSGGGGFLGLGSFLNSVWNGIAGIFNNLFEGVLTPVMNWLGLEDEVITMSSVVSCKVFDTDTLNDTRIRLHLEYQKQGTGILTYAKNYVDIGDNQLRRYYLSGKYDYYNYLPESAVFSVFTDKESILEIAKEELNKPINYKRLCTIVPNYYQWILYKLDTEYNYNSSLQIIQRDNKVFFYKSYSYIDTINEIQVLLQSSPKVSKYTTTITTISKYTSNNTYYKRTVIQESITIRDYKTYILLDTIPSHTVSDTETIISSSEYNSLTPTTSSYTSISIEDISVEDWYINMPMHNNEYVYYLEYTNIDDTTIHYWIANIKDNRFSNLVTPIDQSKEFESFPVAVLREMYHDINEDKDNNQYKQTKRLLKSIGIDIDTLIDNYNENQDLSKVIGGYFIIGVVPSNEHWSVSLALYNLLEYLCITTGDVYPVLDREYSLTFKESFYNHCTMFKIRQIRIVQETLPWGLGAVTHKLINVPVLKSHYLEVTEEKLTDKDYRVTTHSVDKYSYNTRDINFEPFSDNNFTEPIYYHYSNNRTSMIIRTANSKPIGTIDTYERYYSSEEIEELSLPLGTDEDINYYNERHELYLYLTDDNNNPYDSFTGLRFYQGSTNGKDTNFLIVKKQISKEYTKIYYVTDLNSISIVSRGEHRHATSLEGIDENCLIPLPVKAVDMMTLMQKTALLSNCCYMQFYSIEVQHLRWFQTEAFFETLRWVTLAIQITLTVISLGTSDLAELPADELLWQISKMILVSVAVQAALMAIDVLIDDPYLKSILSLGTMVAGIYVLGGFDKDVCIFKEAVSLAESCVKAFDIFTKTSIEQESNSFNKEYNSFTSRYNERTGIFKDIMDSLNTSLTPQIYANLLSSEDIESDYTSKLFKPDDFRYLAIDSYRNFDELYTGFYNKTVHNFCSNLLTLNS